MKNPILIRINRKYKVPVDSIISVTQKRWGSIWVRYKDTANREKIAIAKNSMSNLLMIINNYRCMAQKLPILGVYEK